MSNVAFHTAPGALAQTVTEEVLAGSQRHLHSCQMPHIEAIRKLGTVKRLGRYVNPLLHTKEIKLSLCLIKHNAIGGTH
jgi:hypothetical protein